MTTVLVAGCGGDQSPPLADSPGIAVSLEQVDKALVAGRLPQAQRALADLLATTERSRRAGVLTAEEADRIEEAAAALVAALESATAPEPTPTPTPTPASPAPPPAPAPPPVDSGDDGDGGNDGNEGDNGDGNNGDNGTGNEGRGNGSGKPGSDRGGR